MSRRAVVVNSALAFALAFLLDTFFHELAHAIASLCLGGKPVLHHLYVQSEAADALPKVSNAVIAGAGPAVSFVQGGALLLCLRRFDGWSWMARLVLTWAALLALESTFGYLIATPIASDGDTGAVAHLLGWSAAVRWCLMAAGSLGVYWVGRLARQPFFRLAPRGVPLETAADRTWWVGHALVMAWLLALVLIVPLHLPAPYWLSVVWAVMSGAFALPAWGTAKDVGAPPERDRPEVEGGIRWGWAIVLSVVVVIFRGPLAAGVHLG